MMNAYIKDVLRTVRKNGKRFIALMSITALGLTAFLGINAACRDMYLAADRFYDRQGLFDIRVLSTLGLTEEDVEALQRISGVETADGAYSETVYTMLEDGVTRKSAEMVTLSFKGMNMPYLIQGSLPQNADEIAVTQKYLDETGKSIGDSLTMKEDMPDEGKTDTAGKEEDETGKSDGAAKDGEIAGDGSIEGNGGTKTDDITGEGDDTEEDTDFNSVDWNAEAPAFKNTQYIITGVVVGPMDIANNKGSMAFRSAGATDYSFYVTPEAADSSIYTAVYLTLNGMAGLDCYSKEYAVAVQSAIHTIESEIMDQRQKARYDAVMDEALDKITDAERVMKDNFAEAEQQFADAWTKMEDAKQELADGETRLSQEEKDALKKLADARSKLEDGKRKLRASETKLTEGESDLKENRQKLEEGKTQLGEERRKAEKEFLQAEGQFDRKNSELEASRNQLLPAIEQLKLPFGQQWPEMEWNDLVSASAEETFRQSMTGNSDEEDTTGSSGAEGDDDTGKTPDPARIALAVTEEQNTLAAALTAVLPALEKLPPDADASQLVQDIIQSGLGLGMIEGGRQALEAQRASYEEQKSAALQQLTDAEKELTINEEQLEKAQQEIKENRKKITEGWAEIAKNEKKLGSEETKALQQLRDGWQELSDGKKELSDGEAELIENEIKYQDKKAEAEGKLADAYNELKEIDMAQWYVQDRTSIDSYSSLDSDLSSVEAIGRAFPVLFLVVAVLICLTTMTRMVEEERGLIGTYKALGYGNRAIGQKYILYSFLASAAGSILGNLLGFLVLPKALIAILRSIYIIPGTTLEFDVFYSAAGTLLFMAGIVLATALTCRYELRQTPALLMRPKAPGIGSRILLEYVPGIWNRLKFLNKVTARNLFRYKKRLFMTVTGIAGCTALVLTGFAIRDSVTDMMPKQYENIYRYDLLAVSEAEDYDKLEKHFSRDEKIADFLSVQLGSVKVFNSAGDSGSMQMVVVPAGASLESYIFMPTGEGSLAELNDSGVLITKNAAEHLKLKRGDAVTLQNLQLDRSVAVIGDVVDNYLGNSVFISQALYDTLFGEYEPNAVYAHFTEEVENQVAYADHLRGEEYVLSSISVQKLREEFSSNFVILNAVILILIVLAAGLAFVVLFTLSSTNISERVRELATIKVLGFFDREVHSYANKETLLLTLIGILAGLPLGHLLSGLLLAALKMPSFQFELMIQPGSYLFAAVVSFCFAIIVNLITNRILDRINMVEALKSVE